jgi:hypothetical protein
MLSALFKPDFYVTFGERTIALCDPVRNSFKTKKPRAKLLVSFCGEAEITCGHPKWVVMTQLPKLTFLRKVF